MRNGVRFLALLGSAALVGAEKPSLMAVFAHPDDETIVGPLLARYAREGHKVHLITITSGQKGATAHAKIPAGDELGAAREKELQCSAEKLGISDLTMLRFQDQGISDPRTIEMVAARVREKVNQLKPDVLLTWGADGVTGHPDHRAASNITTQVFQQRTLLDRPPKKLYYVALPESRFRQTAEKRRPFRTVADVFITTVIDGGKFIEPAYASIQCHKTQWTPEQMVEHKEMFEKILEGRVFLRLAMSDGAAANETGVFAGVE